jgi:hypothetical protein
VSETISDERLAEIEALLLDREPRGFRPECRELVREARRLKRENEGLRSVYFDGEFDPASIASQCEYVARQLDSSMHECAALVIRRLLDRVAKAEDAAADAKDGR